MVWFREARKKGTMAFLECIRLSHEDATESYRGRETLGSCLGSYDAVEPVGGILYCKSCWK